MTAKVATDHDSILASANTVESILALVSAGTVPMDRAAVRIKALAGSNGPKQAPAELDDKGRLVLRLTLGEGKESSTGKSIVLATASGKAELPDGKQIRYSANVFMVK